MKTGIFIITLDLWLLIVTQIHQSTRYHTNNECLIESYLILVFLRLVVFAGDSRQKFECLIYYNECASVIGPKVIDTFRECEFPELSAEEFHGLQLCLKLCLHISRE